MTSRSSSGRRGLTFTRNPYGYSIGVSDKNPETMFLPPERGELRQALKEAKTIDRMPAYKKKH
jgi:hypothetical protein